MIKAIPYLPVNDLKKAILFYETKLGFTCAYSDDQGFARLVRDEVELHLWVASDQSWKETFFRKPVVSGAESFIAGTASVRIEVEDIEEIYIEYKNSAVLYSENTIIEEKPWNTLEFPILDLSGNLITLYETRDKS